MIETPYEITCCVTGHRPLKIGGYDKTSPLRAAIRANLRKAVWMAVERGYRVFISGMAIGVDQDFAEVVLEFRGMYPDLGIKLIAAVPFRGQETKWPHHSQQFYRLLLSEADEVIHVCEPGYAGWKMQERNEWMSNRSSLVIAVYDGTSGGTRNCILYAEDLRPKRSFIAINPELVLTPGYEVETLR